MAQVPHADPMQAVQQEADKGKQNWKARLLAKKNKGKADPASDHARTLEKQPPPGVSPSRASSTIQRRPAGSQTNGFENEDGLEELRQQSRQIETTWGHSKAPNTFEITNGPEMQPAPIPNDSNPSNPFISHQNSNCNLNGSVPQSIPDVMQSNAMPFIPGQYSISQVPTIGPSHVNEPKSLQSGYAQASYVADNMNAQIPPNQRSDTFPSYEYNPNTYDSYKRELETLRSEKDQLKLQLNAAGHEISLKVGYISALEELRTTHERTLQEKDSVILSGQTELVNLRATYDRASSQATKLQEGNTLLQKDLSTAHGQRDMADQELLQLKQELKSKVDDKWFQGRWRDLNDKIENLSCQYFVGKLVKSTGTMISRAKGSKTEKVASHPNERLTRLTNAYAQYLGSDEDRPLLIQAFIWWTLVDKIFDHMECKGEGLYWAGQAREQLLCLKNELRPIRRKDWSQTDPNEVKLIEADMRTYHRWRAMTAMMLLNRQPVNRRTNAIGYIITDVIGEMVDTLSPYIILQKDSPRTMAESNTRKQLHVIVTAAIQLDAVIQEQRAWIFCEQWNAGWLQGNPEWGFKYNPEEQDEVLRFEDARNGRKKYADPCVELLVQPALFREGDQYGQEYMKRVKLCSAKVVVGENPTYPSSRRW